MLLDASFIQRLMLASVSTIDRTSRKIVVIRLEVFFLAGGEGGRGDMAHVTKPRKPRMCKHWMTYHFVLCAADGNCVGVAAVFISCLILFTLEYEVYNCKRFACWLLLKLKQYPPNLVGSGLINFRLVRLKVGNVVNKWKKCLSES